MDMQIADAAARVFSDHVDKALLDAAEAGEFPEALWAVVRETGLHLVGTKDSGTTLIDLYGLLKIAGRFAVPLPLAEILIANHLKSEEDGFHREMYPDISEEGFMTIAEGGLAPWGRRAEGIITFNWEHITDFDLELGTNLAGEARDRYHAHASEQMMHTEDLSPYLALGRAATSVGALERVLEMSLEYARQRQQFGRPIAKFQAIQHALARMAGEVAAASCAFDLAVEGLKAACMENPDVTMCLYCNKARVAVAKSRVGEAAGKVVEIAHQVHGAIGFTHEHTLHHYTRRLWAWRDEYGHEEAWQSFLGHEIAKGGADKAWEFIANWS